MEPVIISAVAELKHDKELFKAVAADLSVVDPSDEEALKILEENQVSLDSSEVK